MKIPRGTSLLHSTRRVSGPRVAPARGAMCRQVIQLEKTMRRLQHIGRHSLLYAFLFVSQPFPELSRMSPVKTARLQASLEPNAEHDFDFDIGTWKTHLTRLQHPLTGSTTWVDYEGTTIVRMVWNGRANLAELEADGPAGHLEVLSLRLYDPQAHQWSLNTASSKGGTISVPTIGEFKNGRGEFFDTEPINGRSILVRNIWSDITANSCRFEQAFSADGGKTWEVNWVATDTRVKEDESDKAY